MARPGEFTEADVAILDKYVEDEEVRTRIIAQDAVLKHQDTKLKIIVDSKSIRTNMHGYQMITAKAKLVHKHYTIGHLETDCYLACGHWKKLGHVLDNPQIDLTKHLPMLLPKKRSCIGLFTYQNGIQNTLDDFKRMGNSIISNLSYERPLCIGIYNRTNGILAAIDQDLKRLNNEWLLNHNAILFTRQLLDTLAEILSTVNPQLLWTHVAHSEGGLIVKEVLTTQRYTLSRSQAALKKHLITATYGGVASTPNSVVRHAVNVYSCDDVTMRFAKKHLDKVPWPDTSYSDFQYRELAKTLHKRDPFQSEEQIFQLLKQRRDERYRRYYIETYPYTSTKGDYTVKIVKSLVPKNKQPFFERDHAFQGETYQTALKNDIIDLRDRHGISNLEINV